MGGRIAGAHALMCHCCLLCLVANHETAAGLGTGAGAALMGPSRPTIIVTRPQCTARLVGHELRVPSPPSGYLHTYIRTLRGSQDPRESGVREAIRASKAAASMKPAAPVNRPMTDGAPPQTEGISTK